MHEKIKLFNELCGFIVHFLSDEIVFHRFHDELSDALVNLGYSLKLAIESEENALNAHPNLTF